MKILFFDYWLKGIANFNRLMPELRRQIPDAEIKMLHVGSWKEPQEKTVNIHDGFKSYDISYYKTANLYKVLKKERPDVLLMLNIYFLTDKALITFCKKLGIKTVFLAHGRFGLNATNRIEYEKSNKKLRNSLLSKIRKDTLITLFNYGLSTLIAKRPAQFIKSIKSLIKEPLSMTLNTSFNTELNADRILVYYKSDKDLLVNVRNFPENKIEITGNPELDSFVKQPLLSRERLLEKLRLETNQSYLLYLDDGLVQANLLNEEKWINHLKTINDLAKKEGLQLIIKLHPRTPLDKYEGFFCKEDIKALKNEIDFKSLIFYSSVVTSLASTTISLALFLNKRIISPRFNEVKDICINYPENVIHYSETPEDFQYWLQNDFPTMTNRQYIEDNFEKCDGNVIERIVNKIVR